MPVPACPTIVLYTAHPASGLSRLVGYDGPPPYWAWPWSGGAALGRYLLDRPETVRGRRVLDFGAGAGLVAIAAAKSGAAAVIATEIDPNGAAALRLNAAANGVAVTVLTTDLTGGAPPGVDIVVAGDAFYAPEVAARVLPFLDRCLAAGIEVLVGDPGRADLPAARLRPLAQFHVAEVGGVRNAPTTLATVYALMPSVPDGSSR